MKKYIMILSITGSALFGYSQQQPMYSQFLLNGFLMNPGIAGSSEVSPLRITARQQWAGIGDGPSTQAISGHTPLGIRNNYGVGGYIYNDNFGPVGRTGVQGVFAYHIPVEANTKLALGVSMSAFQYKIDEGNLNIINPNDAAITGKSQATVVPDANFGAYLYNKRYFVGISAAQLIQFQVKLEGYSDLSKIVRHYYVMGGYRFPVSNDVAIEPSLLIKTTERSPVQVDVNSRFFYKSNYWLGFSYRHKDAFVAMLGIKVDRYHIGYAFDYTLSNLSNYTYGSHEIMLGIDLGKESSSNTLL
jgi:type IX secretion system PorP/SprF family membrane protein